MEEQKPLGGEDSALEQFRQEWRNEVHARSKQQKHTPVKTLQPKHPRKASISRADRPGNRALGRHPQADVAEEADHDDPVARPSLTERLDDLKLKGIDEDEFGASGSETEPKSALEHYERAVERESQGNLGDSLSHYRKAYRLDAKVDQSYRNKHFPGKWKAGQGISSTIQPVAPSSTQNIEQKPEPPASFSELISSYVHLSIPGANPIIEGDQEPPCPIRRLPTEVLMELLLQVATNDLSDFARLALVCKRFAYHVFTENSIWKRVALGPELGLASQHYRFATDVQGRESIFRTLEEDENTSLAEQLPPVDENLFTPDTNYREVLHSHPRIRFSGLYISTVNYTRAGGVSATPGTWASSVHIVTYYRYLRFFRDGTLISLLTTNEPIEVVQHLTKENMALVRPLGKSTSSSTQQLTSAKDGPIASVAAQNIMKHALRGRWKMCHPTLTDPNNGTEIGSNIGVAGDVHLETEGAAPRYTYTIHLSLKSGSRSAHAVKNNKLVWKGFWKYNHLTDDWAEFALKNDKPFFFSRVKSYGLG